MQLDPTVFFTFKKNTDQPVVLKNVNFASVDPTVISIINLESDDFYEHSKVTGKYKFGNQLIFINKDFYDINTEVVGNMFPTCIVCKMDSPDKFCSFEDVSITARLKNLASTCYLILPLKNIKFTNKLMTSSINVTLYRGEYSKGKDTRNSLFINSYSITMVSIFIYGIQITDTSVFEIIDSGVIEDSTKIMFEFITSFITKVPKGSKSSLYGNRTHFNRAPDMFTIRSKINHWLFKNNLSTYTGNGYAGHNSTSYSYVSLIKMLWLIEHCITLYNIQHDMETVEE